MSQSLHVSLPDDLRRFVDKRADGSTIYSTPSEYVRDLIRKDMQSTKTALDILQGLEDIKHKRFSKKSILDWQRGGK